MRRNVNAKTKAFARENRRYPTMAETVLWTELRKLKNDGLKFRRQHCVENFIVDFACISIKLAIEIDGVSHAESQVRDLKRTQFLEGLGWKIVRFDNEDVLTNLHEVVSVIITKCRELGL
jgi:5-methyltetrahydrofolate--homocysteine methyltransferase